MVVFDLLEYVLYKNVGNRGFIGVTGLFVHRFVHQLVNLKLTKVNFKLLIYVLSVQIKIPFFKLLI